MHRQFLLALGLALFSGQISGSAAAAQSKAKVIEVPQRKKPSKSTEYHFPATLVGGFTEAHAADRQLSGGAFAVTHSLVGRGMTWVPVPDDPDDLPPLPGSVQWPTPAWGKNVRYKDYRLSTDGEITVGSTRRGSGVAGSCIGSGSKTFALSELPAEALNYFLLRLGSNGRYFLRFGMMGGYLTFQENNSCTKKPLEVNEVTVMLTPGFEGPVVYGVKGGLPAPRLEAGMSVSGSWDFAEPNRK
jgi:hypothetical protein